MILSVSSTFWRASGGIDREMALAAHLLEPKEKFPGKETPLIQGRWDEVVEGIISHRYGCTGVWAWKYDSYFDGAPFSQGL